MGGEFGERLKRAVIEPSTKVRSATTRPGETRPTGRSEMRAEDTPTISEWFKAHQPGGTFSAFRIEDHPELVSLKTQIDVAEAQRAKILAGTKWYQLLARHWVLQTLEPQMEYLYALMSAALWKLYAPEALQAWYSADPITRRNARARFASAAGASVVSLDERMRHLVGSQTWSERNLPTQPRSEVRGKVS